MSDSQSSNPNYCEVCGKPAIQAAPRDPFGKSDALRHLCGEHGFRLRDPADVAEIERLTALQAAHEGVNLPAFAELLAERDRLRAALAEFVRIDDEDARGLMCDMGSDLVLALIEARKLLAGTADGPAEQPVEIDARCQPTLTECPHCHNDLSKCVGLFKRPAEETSEGGFPIPGPHGLVGEIPSEQTSPPLPRLKP